MTMIAIFGDTASVETALRAIIERSEEEGL
jgi:hypothetical protein